MDDDGDEYPVAHFSRKIFPTEEKFSTIEKKCLAIDLAIQAIGLYILSRDFTIQTDHRALEWLYNLEENNRSTTSRAFVVSTTSSIRYDGTHAV